MKTSKTNWLLKHTFTVFSCVLIVAFGIAFLSHADPVTTTIGENIATNDLSVAGNVTSGTWQGTTVGTQYSGTGQDWSAVAQGNLPYFSAEGALSNLAPRTAGQFLKSQGADADPEWANVTRSATFVVAANDSSALSKQQADYVCDGTDDQVEIQAAIDAGVQGYKKVFLSAGTFYIKKNGITSKSAITPRSGLMLEGSGRATILRVSSSNTNAIDAEGLTGEDIILRNFTIDVNKDEYPRTDHDSMGVWILKEGDKTAFKRILIENLYIYDTGANGIYCTGVDVKILNNTVYNAGSAGIEIGGDNTLIRGNVITCDDGENDHSIEILGGLVPTNVIIDNNFCSGADGLYLQGTSQHLIITNNIFKNIQGATRHPIRSIGNQNHVICTGNYFSGYYYTVQSLIYWRNYIFANNRLFNAWFDFSVYNPEFGAVITNNSLVQNALLTPPAAPSQGGKNVICNNAGHITESSGTATLVNTTTSIAVTHGLDVVPSAGDITVTPIEAWGAMTEFYIDTYTSTQFTIHADQDPGQDVDFVWKAIVL